MFCVKLRYNHDHEGSLLRWRILIDGKEFKAERVEFHVKTWTTEDTLPSGEVKYHVSAIANDVRWEGNVVVVL